ncbi:MAG TPA: hypothetical protein VEI82_09495, partial [Myxococcota bacterium]|nr:hypothetical protein [Myxococcota bacterium]
MTLRGRWILIGIVTVLMSYLALPSFFSDEARASHWWLGKDGMTLGLDLQGGVHWLLRVDEDAAVQRELERVQSAIADAASEGKVELSASEVKAGALTLHGDLAGLRKIVDENAPSADVDE